MSRVRPLVPVLLLAASVGTAHAGSRRSTTPHLDAADYPVVGNAMTKTAPRPQALQAQAPPQTDTTPSARTPIAQGRDARTPIADRELTKTEEQARRLLRSMRPDHVRADLHPFLALCDADGYPVVGNAAQTTKMSYMQPSELCTIVREKRAAAATRVITATAKPRATTANPGRRR